MPARAGGARRWLHDRARILVQSNSGCRRDGLVALTALTLTACGTGEWLTESSTDRAADQHAATAGTVMTRDNWERTANDAAYLVVGQGLDDTIDALDVEGTTYQGGVVLRITVEQSGEFGDGPTTNCYAYTFQHEQGDQRPDTVPCCG